MAMSFEAQLRQRLALPTRYTEKLSLFPTIGVHNIVEIVAQLKEKIGTDNGKLSIWYKCDYKTLHATNQKFVAMCKCEPKVSPIQIMPRL